MSFELERLPDGNLKLKIVPDEWEEGRDWDRLVRERYGLHDLMEESRYTGNGWAIGDGNYFGHMTDAPMITDDMSVEDDGDVVVYGTLWWFPNYMVEDPVATLRDRGEVIFRLGAKPGELVPPKWRHKLAPDGARFRAARPHGLCGNSRICREHALNKKVPSCKGRRGKGRRS